MIAFGTAISNRRIYEEIALPGIRRAAESDSKVLVREGYNSIQRPYNEMIDEVAGLPDLEGLVLLHQDLDLTDGSLLPRIRRQLRDPSVGIVGALGWRRSSPRRGESPKGPEPVRAPGERLGQGFSEGAQEVELIDGILMALSPWVIRAVRFDMRLAKQFHGYDLDFSLRVRSRGGRLICDSIPHVHHMSRPWRDREEYVQAMIGCASRWDSDVNPDEWAPAFSP